MPKLEAKRLDVTTSPAARRVGAADIAVVSLGDMKVTREVARPGWRWSRDVKPLVGTELCQASHQIYVVSGRIRVRTQDGAELTARAGDALTIPPGHDAWVEGDEPCEMIDFCPVYNDLIEAGQALRDATGPARAGGSLSRREAAARLRALAQSGRLDSSAVEIVLGAVGQQPGRRVSGPAGLTPREMQVLVLIATGAATKQAAYALGISAKTAATHVERIYAKIGVSSRAAATRFAIQHGLVKPLDSPT